MALVFRVLWSSAVPAERGGGLGVVVVVVGAVEMDRGEVEQQLNLSRWHLFYFLPGHLEFT